MRRVFDKHPETEFGRNFGCCVRSIVLEEDGLGLNPGVAERIGANPDIAKNPIKKTIAGIFVLKSMHPPLDGIWFSSQF